MTEAKRAVIVTGGGSGIGYECAKHAADAGASVAIIDVSEEAARNAVARLPGEGHRAYAVDVTDADAMKSAVDDFAAANGTVTGVVAAAGIVSRTKLADVTSEEFARVFAVNVAGVQNTISAAAPHLVAHGQGASVVAMSSVGAYVGGGLMGSGVYAASKAAVVGLVRGYARELAPYGVRANAVAPAATETPMTSVLTDEERARISALSLIGRLSTPAEIAATVQFLLSDGAGSITGQVIQPNGGVYFN